MSFCKCALSGNEATFRRDVLFNHTAFIKLDKRLIHIFFWVSLIARSIDLLLYPALSYAYYGKHDLVTRTIISTTDYKQRLWTID